MHNQYTEIVASATINFLDFYAKHGAALFPLPRGSKAPHGIVASFKHDFSRDRETWRRWAVDNIGCNFGVVGFASSWIICDIDTAGGEYGAAEAWAAWTELCKSWELPDALPAHVRSPSGGFHVYFAVPASVDASDLRQPDAIKGRINVRCVGYTVAAGSQFEGKPYTLLNDIPPHPAPDGLIKHCTRKPRKMSGAALPDIHDFSDVAALVTWMAEKEMFAAYEDWVAAGMALKASFGSEGYALWDLTHDGDISPSQAESKWESFASVTDASSVTILSLVKRARDAGWTGSVRKSTAAMFEGVAEMFAAWQRGETWPALSVVPLPIGSPLPDGWRWEGDVTVRVEMRPSLPDMPLPNHPNLTAPQAASLVKFWAHLPSGKIIHEPSRGLWASGSFDKHIGRIKDAMKTEGPGMLASTWASQHHYVDSMGWDPAKPMVIEDRILTDNGWIHAPACRSFNTYLPPDIELIEGDVSKWLDHIRFIYPNEADHVVHWFAHQVQKPGDKVNHGLVFIGDPGIGKDTAIEPVVAAIGPHNFKSITAASFFKSDFNGYLKSVMLRIDEVHDLGGESKYAFHDRTKTILAAPPMAHQINEKFVPHHSAVNVCGTILTSNHPDALYLPRDDRRHFVCISTRTKDDFPNGYFDNLYAWFENGGNEAVAHFLANLDMSAFNAKAPPAKSAGWHMVVAAGLAPESGDLSDAIEALGSPAALTLQMIRARTPSDSQLRASLEDVKLRKAIPKRLGEAGYIAVPNPDAASDGRWRIGKNGKATIYARRELREDERLAAARALAIPPLPY